MANVNTDIRVFPDLTTLSVAAVQLFVDSAAQAIRERGRFLVSLGGGSTPMALYRQLVREPIDWTRVHVFWGDERLVLPEDSESNYGQASEALLKHVPIPAENVHRVASELESAAAVTDYALTLKRFASPPLDWPRFDLVLLGMGKDGHTASLFPGSPVEMKEPVIAVTGHYQNRPANRISLTPLVINAARLVTFLVSGNRKAAILSRVLSKTESFELLPAQRIRPTEGKVVWLVDKTAGSLITLEE